MKRNPLTITIGALLIVVFFVLLTCGQVRKSTVVVITTFGKATRTLPDPGFYMKWPWPIQQAHVFDQRIQNFDDKFDEAQTFDHYTLLTMTYVGWKIKDPQAFFPKFANGSNPEAQIHEAERTMEG